MSRSYKKNPWWTDGKNGQVKSKRFANKKVRRFKQKIENGNAYKKIFCSWNIHDYKNRWTWSEAKKEYDNEENGWQDDFTIKEFYRIWKKYYSNK